MKRIIIIILSLSILTGVSACESNDKDNPEVPPQSQLPKDNNNNDSKENMKLKLTIDSATFIATLKNNATADAFRALLPMTINMEELNNNEKYYDLSSSLPVSPSGWGTIENGDLMLFGSSTLVLFYNTFTTSYSYTRIGKIDDPSGLQSALGTDNTTVTFELYK